MAERTDTKRRTTITRRNKQSVIRIGGRNRGMECGLCPNKNARFVRRENCPYAIVLCDECLENIVRRYGKEKIEKRIKRLEEKIKWLETPIL